MPNSVSLALSVIFFNFYKHQPCYISNFNLGNLLASLYSGKMIVISLRVK